MLSQDIIIMATLTDMVTDMAIMDMDTPMEDMVDMVMDMDMERGKLMLKPDILIMDMAMVDMVMDMATMDMERGRPPPDILIMVMVDMVMDMVMVMVMDTMVKQYLFISFSKFCCIHWNLLESSQKKHRPL